MPSLGRRVTDFDRRLADLGCRVEDSSSSCGGF